MQPGDLVRLKHGSLFYPNHLTFGTVSRMPLPPELQVRQSDACVMVQVGKDPRNRPMDIAQLEELGQKGTPLTEIAALHADWSEKRKKRLKELEAIAAEAKKV